MASKQYTAQYSAISATAERRLFYNIQCTKQ